VSERATSEFTICGLGEVWRSLDLHDQKGWRRDLSATRFNMRKTGRYSREVSGTDLVTVT
jgi:hypothetical protein